MLFRSSLGASPRWFGESSVPVGVRVGSRCERGLPGRYVHRRRRFLVDVSPGQVRSRRSLAILMRIWADGALAWAFPELESTSCPSSVVTRPGSSVCCFLALRGSGRHKAGSCRSVGLGCVVNRVALCLYRRGALHLYRGALLALYRPSWSLLLCD